MAELLKLVYKGLKNESIQKGKRRRKGSIIKELGNKNLII
ncbi:hypothetical protein KUL156_61330 [Alteromonas sp. KUL156]|nr:hypothetical protein KUL156_61330 [Alteromonas sp. KUL156]